MSQVGLVTASVLNFRAGPGTRFPIIGKFKRGTRLNISTRADGWYEIRRGQRSGFVFGSYVYLIDGAPGIGFLRNRKELNQVTLNAPTPIPVHQRMDWASKRVARTWNRSGGLVGLIGDVVQVDAAIAIAVLIVESGGSGFGADGRLVIRFENHVFWREWGERHPGTFRKHFKFDAKRRWLGHRFRRAKNATWQAFHGQQTSEWQVLEIARGLNGPAALKSISMGAAQIMGFNHSRIGYDSAQEMLGGFQESEREQIIGLFDLLKGPTETSPMIQALQRRSFIEFAAGYNGPGQAAKYGERLAQNVEVFESLIHA